MVNKLSAAIASVSIALSTPAVLAQQSPVQGAAASAQAAVLMPAPKADKAASAEKTQADAQDEAALKQLHGAVEIASKWVNRPELARSYVGLEIMDCPSGRTIFSHNGDHRFVTASIAKVITTACAFDTFGGGYVFKTSLVGYGELRGSKLAGALSIVPSEDPSFTSEDLKELLSCLEGKVKTVNGPLVINSVQGGGDHFSTEWLVQDWGQDWMPCSSDLVVDRNIVKSQDAGRGMPVVVEGADSQPSTLTGTLLRSPWAPSWVVYNRASNNVTFYRPESTFIGGLVVGNPTEFNAAQARMILKSDGIKVENHEVAPSEQVISFGDHLSKPLPEIIRFTLKESDNLYAQQMLRLLGTLEPVNKALSLVSLEERGLFRVQHWLSGIGVRSGDVVMFDGCGLTRKNAITPHALNMVLKHMTGPQGDGPYSDLLSHEGEGSLRTFRFKTGAMDGVRSIAGIVRTSTGQPFAVTVVINDHTPSVRELRGSLNSLITQLESLGQVKLKPQAPAARVQHIKTSHPLPLQKPRHVRHKRIR